MLSGSLILEEKTMTYFIADLHLGHSNIITLCERPFSSVEEMNETIIGNWNSRITDVDDVYILGDFAYKSSEDVTVFLKKMKGHKHLVIGNHDNSWMNVGGSLSYFDSVKQMDFLSFNGRQIWLCHYPMMEWNDSLHGSYLIFGHIHNNVGQPYWNLIKTNDRMLNAGVEVNNFYPVTFEELVRNNEVFKAMN